MCLGNFGGRLEFLRTTAFSLTPLILLCPCARGTPIGTQSKLSQDGPVVHIDLFHDMFVH